MKNGQRYTRNAMQEFMFGLPSSFYDIIIKPTHSDEVSIRKQLTPNQLLREVPYLRHRNVNGCHIYGRPSVMRHVLIDDISPDGINALRADGLHPNLVIETSPHNYQAWVTLFPAPLLPPKDGRRGTENFGEWAELSPFLLNDDLPADIATAAARLLAERYHGDSGSADARHLGRLPQFTNRKPMYEADDGRFPWTWVVSMPRRTVARGASALLRDAIMVARSRASSSSPRGGCVPFDGASSSISVMTPDEARMIYEHTLMVMTARFGGERFVNDRSETDFAIARHLALTGFDDADIAAVLLHASVKAHERGADYIARTVTAARHR